MGFLDDVNLDDAVEPTAVPGDTEYKLRITDAKEDTDKNGNPYLLPRFEAVDHPAAKEFTKFLRLPHPDQSDKEKNNTLWALKLFSEAFDFSFNSLDLESIIGNEGWAILGVEETDEYGEQNFIKKFVIGS